MRVSLTRVSENKKTGPIPVSMTEQASCPSNCQLRGNGCYAEVGPLALHWRKVPDKGLDWPDFCAEISRLPKRQMWRHNQAGDLPSKDGGIDLKKLAELVRANGRRKGFTYTHHDLHDPANRAAVKAANASGFTINASADTLEEADLLYDLGLPVTVVVPSFVRSKVLTPKGRTVAICPASVRDDITCATCGVCAVAHRKAIIGFPAHGVRRKVIDLRLEAA